MFWKKLFIFFCGFWPCGYLFAQNIAVNTTGTAAAALNMFEVTQANNTSNSVGIFSSNVGTGTNAYAIWAEATGATNKYAFVVPPGGGSVGIGTITPGTALHIFSADATPLQVKAEQTNATTLSQFVAVGENSNAIIYMRQGNSGLPGTTYGNMPFSGSIVSGTSNANGLILNSANATAPMVFVTGGTAFTNERMRIDANGLVGIGTPAPVWDVDVTKAKASAGVVVNVQNTSAGANASAGLLVQNDASKWAELTLGSSTATTTTFGLINANIANYLANTTIAFGNSTNSPIIFGTNNLERMRLMGNGTLKITGTAITSPGIWMDGTITAAAGTAYGILSRGTLTAAVNGDAFIPFSNSIGTANTGTFTGLIFYGAQLDGASWVKSGTGTINNGYGLYVTAPTIATSNYAAVFTGGHVGIGTTTPAAGLDIVYGGVVSSSASKILHSGTAALNPGTALRVSNGYPAAGGNYEVFGVYGNSFGTNYFSVLDNGRTYLTAVNEQYGLGVKYVSTGGAVYFGAKSGVATPDAVISNAGGATLMTLQNAGNVGIGTPTPSQKLEINGGVLLNTTTAQPACAAATRGLIWFVQGAAGVKDRCEVCAKDAADAYAWRVLY